MLCCSWEFNASLKQDLERYVSRNFKRNEILDFVKQDYLYYKWSLRSLARWLKTFGISYSDILVPVEKVARAVFKEINGPGALQRLKRLDFLEHIDIGGD